MHLFDIKKCAKVLAMGKIVIILFFNCNNTAIIQTMYKTKIFVVNWIEVGEADQILVKVKGGQSYVKSSGN